jgi:hypothetical protein
MNTRAPTEYSGGEPRRELTRTMRGLMAGFFAAGAGRFELMPGEVNKAIAVGGDAGQIVPACCNVVWASIARNRVKVAEQALQAGSFDATSTAA